MSKEENFKESMNELGIELPKEEEENNVAFKSTERFLNAISTEEFNSVIETIELSYNVVSDFVNTREKTRREARERLTELKEEASDNQRKEMFSRAVKIAKREMKKLESEIMTKHDIHFRNFKSNLDFLNRFKKSDELLPGLDLEFYYEFIKNKK